MYTILITQGFEAFTEPSVGAIRSSVAELAVVIHVGRAESSASEIVVKAPVVAHEPTVQARIAGLDVYALALTEGRGRVTDVVEPTAAFDVVPVPLSHGCWVQSQEGALTVTVKETVTWPCYAL